MIGLEKLSNLNDFNGLGKSRIFKKLLKKEISLKNIENHKDYHKISNRIKYFEQIDKLLDKQHSKIIINFDNSLVSNTKLLRTVFMFYAHEKSGYTHLTIGKEKEKYYPETFFHEDSKRYISGQELLNIVDIQIENINTKR